MGIALELRDSGVSAIGFGGEYKVTVDEVQLPTTREALMTWVAQGAVPAYLFFWGHRAKADNVVGKSCLSQWFTAAFECDGTRYLSAEHFMMAEKARLFNDLECHHSIVNVADPAQAKALGREVRHFDAQIWSAHCFDIVVQGNLAKFSQHSLLKSFLLASAGQVLVEASPHDRIWGIGLRESDAKAADVFQWQGQNLLGFALMVVRDRLAREAQG